MWKVNEQQTTDAKWWQKLILPLARWAKNTCSELYLNYDKSCKFAFLSDRVFTLGNELWKSRVYTLILCKIQRRMVYLRLCPRNTNKTGSRFIKLHLLAVFTVRVTSRNVKAKSFWYDVEKIKILQSSFM